MKEFLLINLVSIGSFCGVLLGATIVIKNQKTNSTWPFGILLIILGTVLGLTTILEDSVSYVLLLVPTIVIPVVMNIYFKLLAKPKTKFSKKHIITIGITTLVATHFLANSLQYLNGKVLIVSLALGMYGFYLRRKFLANEKHPTKKSIIFDRWLLPIHVVLLLYYLMILYASLGNNINTSFMSVQFGISILLIGLCIISLLAPEYLYLNQFTNLQGVTENSISTLVDNSEKKSVRYVLPEELKEEYVEKITDYMESVKPFLQKSFTLNKLSYDLDLSPTYTSRVINEVYGKNFMDFINGYRIQCACKNLLEESFSNYTIEGIAQESGFNSRTAFYNAFKKVMNMSPGEYISKHIRSWLLDNYSTLSFLRP